MKSIHELRAGLRYALENWGRLWWGFDSQCLTCRYYGRVDRTCGAPKNRCVKDDKVILVSKRKRKGSKHLMGPADEWQGTYESYWRDHSPKLPENLRLAVELRFIHGYNRDMVAKELEVTPATVSEYCHRGLEAIARIMYARQEGEACPRCGFHSLVRHTNSTTDNLPELKCMLCGRRVSRPAA